MKSPVSPRERASLKARLGHEPSGNYTEISFEVSPSGHFDLLVGYFHQEAEPDNGIGENIEVESAHAILDGGKLLDLGSLIAELGAWEALAQRVWEELRGDWDA